MSTMRKAVVLGFASSEGLANKIAKELSGFYDEDIEGMPFRKAANNPLELDRFVKGAAVLGHSAALGALRGTHLREVVAVAPAIPVPIWRLLGRGAVKSVRDTVRSMGSGERAARMREIGSLGAPEMLCHPVANLRQLPMISRSHALWTGVGAAEDGIDATLGFMRVDEFGFRPAPQAVARARKVAEGSDVSNRLHIATDVEGVHDEFLIDPVETLKRVLRAARTEPSNPDGNLSHFWHPSFEE